MPTVMSSGPESIGRPAVAHELLGRMLRALRESREITRAAAGQCIECSESKISRMELGETVIKEVDLQRLLDLYEVRPGEQRLAMVRLAGLLNARQWWHDYKDVLAGWFCSYLVLESMAGHIRTYETRFVPGLLQTPAYAEAVFRLQYDGDTDIQRRVDVRMQRQKRVLRRKAPGLWATIDEAALSLEIASPAVMREQIDFLMRATRSGSITIQVLPTGPAAAAAGGMSFSMLRLPVEQLSDVVYLEQISSAMFFDEPSECDPYVAAWSRLTRAAREPRETMPFLMRARRAVPGGGLAGRS